MSCKEIYYELIDTIMGEHDRRFQPETLDLYHVSRKITQMQDFSGGNFANRLRLSLSDSEQMLFHGMCKKILPESSDLMMYLDICIPDIIPGVYQLLTSITVFDFFSISRASILHTETN